ncbi:MAG: sulfotransferase [Paraburkholderia sp.]|uniref:sulfotransferase n=1 Tax=Paraburkholderia sp. TaxID=1926495 RepID=UPI003C3284F7
MISDFTPLFVVGAPRSGTTILHALVCASEKTNGYVNECCYSTELIKPFLTALGTFDTHTKALFDTREAFALHYWDILKSELALLWRKFGRPDVLALKDPMMTPLVPHLAKLVHGSKFVVPVRDPRAVISSRIEAAHKEWAANR